jgi:hypothetical protein
MGGHCEFIQGGQIGCFERTVGCSLAGWLRRYTFRCSFFCENVRKRSSESAAVVSAVGIWRNNLVIPGRCPLGPGDRGSPNRQYPVASDDLEYSAFARCLDGAGDAVQHRLPDPCGGIRRDAVGGHPGLLRAGGPGLVSEAQMATVMRRSRNTSPRGVLVTPLGNIDVNRR